MNRPRRDQGKEQMKEKARTARERRKPVRCWFSGKRVLSCEQEARTAREVLSCEQEARTAREVLSCEQERLKRKVKPRASHATSPSGFLVSCFQIQLEVN
jgi:hypothetical protein